MARLNLIGPIFGSSGYASHTRNLLNAFAEIGVEVSLETQLVPGWELMVNDVELAAIKRGYDEKEDVLFVGLPQFWQVAMNRPHRKFAGYVVWEGTKVPQYFRAPMAGADVIIVPSVHVKDAVLRTFPSDNWLREKTVIVPHGVDHALFVEQPRPGRFTFLANKGWNQGDKDRGGLQYLFRAWAEEFGPDEPVDLWVKINMAYGGDPRAALEALNLKKPRREIQICTETVQQAQLKTFYSGDVFVSPSMADAFNIPCIEAMACGLPVITTGFGGQTDYVNEENGWLLPFVLKPVTWDVMHEGNYWAEPSIDELRRIMRYCFEHRDECHAKGEQAAKTALGYSWRNTAEKILEALR